MKNLTGKLILNLLTWVILSTIAYAQDSPLGIYFGYVKSAVIELIDQVKNLTFPVKIAILIFLVILGVAVYLRTRDTGFNNMRRARQLHEKAVKKHEKGNTEGAAKHYQRASEYREKAEDQL